MKILAIDTTRDELLVILRCGEKLFTKKSSSGKKGHSSSLLPFIDEIMAKADILPNQLSAVGAVIGAGSFTGIRIGVATMNAVAFATGAKRISINSFELLANGESGSVLCTVPALHGNLYGALYENEVEIEKGFYTTDALPKHDKLIRQEEFSDFENSLAEVSLKKFEKGEFVSQIRPLYLRKSQAERAQDEI